MVLQDSLLLINAHSHHHAIDAEITRRYGTVQERAHSHGWRLSRPDHRLIRCDHLLRLFYDCDVDLSYHRAEQGEARAGRQKTCCGVRGEEGMTGAAVFEFGVAICD